MKKLLILPVFGLVFLLFSPVLAEENPQLNKNTPVIENPGVLPSNPFYFLKEWRRGIKRFFTFDPVAKLELELKVVAEKAVEVLKVQEALPDDEESVMRAIENYRDAQERLKSRLKSLRDTSKNPNIDRLLDQLAERAIQHEALFDDLADKFNEQSEIQGALEEAKKKIEEVVGVAASKDDPEKFSNRLKKYNYSSEMIDGVFSNAPEAVKESLSQIRDDFADRLRAEFAQTLKELAMKISEHEKLFVIRELTKVSHPQIYGLLENAKYHLRLANSVFSKNDLSETKLHIGHIQGFLKELSSLIELTEKPELKLDPVEPVSMCGQIQCLRYDPVCGEDGKTYSCGEADAKSCGASVAYKGECRKEEPVFCLAVVDPVCGVNGKTYSNDCVAGVAGVEIKYKGACSVIKPIESTPSY